MYVMLEGMPQYTRKTDRGSKAKDEDKTQTLLTVKSLACLKILLLSKGACARRKS